MLGGCFAMANRQRVVNTLLVALGVVVVLVAVIVWQRHYLMFSVLSSGEPPPLKERSEEHPDARWYDNYFIVEEIDPRTFAIGEPLYHQQNFSYLIAGEARAVLFDAGPGYRDIRAVAESLTDLPITFVPSHFHFDHTGNLITFDRVAVVDLPYLRVRARGNRLTLTWREHLGAFEGVDTPTLVVDEWLPIGSLMQLGGRDLRVLYTPGHTTDSISLLDTESGALFTGDFIYPGPLFAFLPNSSLPEYLAGTVNVLRDASADSALYTAHRVQAPGVPTLDMTDVADLQETLLSIRSGNADGEGFYPHVYPVNERLELLAEPPWLQDWDD